MTVSIDGAPPYNTSYNDPTPQSYVQWYQSPILPEGTHNITLTHMAGTALDYAVITAGQNTPLTGKTVIVDNEDSSIRFTGSWTRNTARFHSGYSPDGYAFRNSTHQSNTTGDNFIFRFSGDFPFNHCFLRDTDGRTGTSLYIYGMLHWADLGTVSASYTLDGETTPVTYSVTTSSSMHQDNTNDQPNFLLYTNTSLTAGDHTLVVNVTKCVNQTFIFDYLTYQPSFSTLATMPNLTLPASTNGTPHTTTTSTPVGAIVGGILGGLALLFLLIGAFLWFRKRKAQDDQGESNQITAFAVPSSEQENLGRFSQYP